MLSREHDCSGSRGREHGFAEDVCGVLWQGRRDEAGQTLMQVDVTYADMMSTFPHRCFTVNMSSIFSTPARRVLLATQRASPIATTSAYTLSGWVGTKRSMSSTAQISAAEQQATTTQAPSSAETTTSGSVGTPRPTTHYRITLRRSAIGLPSRMERVVKALGLKKRLSTVYHLHSESIAGSILALKEIVHVDNVRRLDPPVGRLASVISKEDLEAWHSMIPDHEAVWLDANGDVVHWGDAAKKAPRGYRVVGNLISEQRDQEIREAQALEHDWSSGVRVQDL